MKYKLAVSEEGKPLAQGSDQWLDYRLGKIGATAFANLLASEELTPNQWTAGVLEDIVIEVDKIYNPPKYKSTWKPNYMKLGNLTEPMIKKEVIFNRGILAVPYTLEYVDNPRIYSSYDALDLENGHVYEIKTTKTIKEFDEWETHFYLGQIIHELMVAYGGEIPSGTEPVATLVVFDKRNCTDLKNITDNLYYSHIVFNQNIFTAYELRPVFTHLKMDAPKEVANIAMPKYRWISLCEKYLNLYDDVSSNLAKTSADLFEETKKTINLIKQAGNKASPELILAVQQSVFLKNDEEKDSILKLLIDKLEKIVL